MPLKTLFSFFASKIMIVSILCHRYEYVSILLLAIPNLFFCFFSLMLLLVQTTVSAQLRVQCAGTPCGKES